MQHVNDDMDDIFRRAGKDYPLDTSGADWDKIAAGLQSAAVIHKKGDNRRYLWLLLLLPFAWICTRYIDNSNTEKIAAKETNINKEEKSAEQNPVHLKEQKLFNAGGAAEEHLNKPRSFSDGGIVSENHFQSDATGSLNGNNYILQDRKGTVTKIKTRTVKTSYSDNNFPTDPKEKTDYNSLPAVTKNSVTKTEGDRIAKDPLSILKPGIKNDVDVEKKEQDVVAGKTDVAKTAETTDASTETKQKTEKQRKERFYLAPVAGFSVTSIKGQKLSDPGTDYGILAGVKINQNFSLEAGLLSTRKNYYSEGSYYDKSRIYMPANAKLTTVSGDCRMVEIPLSIRYDFKPAARSHWFAAAGISNFLMKKENYDYTYYYYSTNYYATYHKTYEKASRDWMSVLQLSGGYNYSLKNGLRLRLEPYLQLPLKGVGYGDLPLTSYGFRLGIEKGFRF
jgi:hypothetical protein